MKYLVDSDFLYALYKPDDSNHQKAIKIYKDKQNEELIVLNLVVQESTTLVSKRVDMSNAKSFYELVLKIVNKNIYLDIDLERDSWKIFLKQNKKGTSFIDCANLATYNKLKLDGILSFDEFYRGAEVRN